VTGMRERKKAQNRAALLASGRKLFADKGVDATSMESVAADADISTPSLYNYFRSKDELLAAIIVQDLASEIVDADAVVATPPRPARSAYLKLIGIYFAAFDSIDRAMLRRFTAHAIGREDSAYIDYFGVDSQLLAQIEQMTVAMCDAGILPPGTEPKRLARAIFSIANSEYYAYIANDEIRSDRIVKIIADQFDLLLEGRSGG
jgi:AcrR family transcriptional regulator